MNLRANLDEDNNLGLQSLETIDLVTQENGSVLKKGLLVLTSSENKNKLGSVTVVGIGFSDVGSTPTVSTK